MKSLFVIVTVLLSLNAQAKVLTKPFKIKLVSVDGRVDFTKYEALMEVSCSYKMLEGSGEIWFPQIPTMGSGSCGHYTEKLQLNVNNELGIPSLRPTDNNQGYKLKNLIVSISLTDKVSKRQLLAIKTAGKEGINQLINNSEPVNVFTANVNGINVVYDGGNFFDSDLPREKGAYLTFRFSNYKPAVGRIFIDSAYTRPFAMTKNLPEIRSIDLGEVTFAQLGNHIETADIEINYTNSKFPKIKTPKASLPVTVESLESLKSVILQ